MKDFTDRYPGRRWDKLYYTNVDDGMVHEVQAFLCPPNDEDIRWVPEFGISTNIGHSLQPTKEGANKRLATELKELEQRLSTRLETVRTLRRLHGDMW